MYIYLIVFTICATAGLQAWRTLFDNFAVSVIGLQGEHIGIIQSVREIPGLLTFLVIYLLLVIKEYHLSALSILMLGAGIGLAGFFPSFSGLMMTTLVMSFGFHYYETTNQSLTLQYFDTRTSPVVFGKQRSMAAASNIGIGILIYFIAPVMSYKAIFLMVGGMILLVGIWGLFQNPADENIAPQRKQMIVRKKYSLFYFLTFMAGARRQIFIAFAVFLLVKKFGFTIREITILFLVNNLINYFLSPFIGRCIVSYGERKVLTLEYFSLIIIFIGYGMVDSKIIVAILYIADHIFFNFAIAIRTYFQKVADPRDIAPSMSVGFAINHIAAVFFPALGGMLWMMDYRIPFFCGAVFSFISLIAVQRIRIPSK
ncbi:MAG: MFS transporter [Proteobacteria bacterium]|nr:MFS transporter [Pseudomonadota bacterium]